MVHALYPVDIRTITTDDGSCHSPPKSSRILQMPLKVQAMKADLERQAALLSKWEGLLAASEAERQAKADAETGRKALVASR